MVALIVRNENCVVKLVTALVAKLICIVHLCFKNPVCLCTCNLDLVTDSNLTCNVAVINVDSIVAVNEDNAAGNHTVCISDSCNDTGDSYLLANLGSSCFLDCCCRILRGIDLNLNVLIVDESCVLNLRIIIVCAENAMKKNEISCNCLICHLGILESAVRAISTVNVDLTCFVHKCHFAVAWIGESLNCTNEVVALGCTVLTCSLSNLNRFGDGDDIIGFFPVDVLTLVLTVTLLCASLFLTSELSTLAAYGTNVLALVRRLGVNCSAKTGNVLLKNVSDVLRNVLKQCVAGCECHNTAQNQRYKS